MRNYLRLMSHGADDSTSTTSSHGRRFRSLANLPKSLVSPFVKALHRFRPSYVPESGKHQAAFNGKLARLWRDHCLSQHSTCRAAAPSPGAHVPSRLVEITGAPFLIETTKAGFEWGPYVTLSYCWGEGARFLTLKKNARAHHRSIPSVSLPTTFKDAVHVARSLGYRYLWIDALCIIQDDGDDMRREIARMGDTYRHADLTIAAQGTPNANDGLFYNSKHPLLHIPCTIRVKATGLDLDAHITEDATFSIHDSVTNSDCLSRRGWILQEYILSRRTLAFGAQMRWKCLEAAAAETKPVPEPYLSPRPENRFPPNGTQLLQLWIHAPEEVVKGAFKARDEAVLSAFDAWYSMIKQYTTERELTFHKDLLSAVAGPGQVLSQRHLGTYVAGLWKEDLVNGLAWYVDYRRGRKGPSHCQIAEVRSRSPSWSWASAGKVYINFEYTRETWDQGESEVLDDLGLSEHPISLDIPPKELENLVAATERHMQWPEVLDVFCISEDPINLDVPPGPGKAAKPWGLTLLAPLQRAVIHYRARIAMALIHPDGADQIGGDGRVGQAFPDCPLEVALFGERPPGLRMNPSGIFELDVFCLPLRYHGRPTAKHITCLLLIPYGQGTGLYVRVGFGRLYPAVWRGSKERLVCEII